MAVENIGINALRGRIDILPQLSIMFQSCGIIAQGATIRPVCCSHTHDVQDTSSMILVQECTGSAKVLTIHRCEASK
jgi:hypothetical protein